MVGGSLLGDGDEDPPARGAGPDVGDAADSAVSVAG